MGAKINKKLLDGEPMRVLHCSALKTLYLLTLLPVKTLPFCSNLKKINKMSAIFIVDVIVP